MGIGDGLAHGIDVSKWQPRTPPLDGLDFLVARASIGLLSDSLYAEHIRAAKAAGLVTGAYHFNEDSVDPAEQADLFVRIAGDVDLLFIDVEGTMAFSPAQTERFIARVHELGRKCGLYHSAAGYFDAGQDYDWIAKWSVTPPSHRWDFWQEGSIALNGKRIDHNYFRGSPAELRDFVRKNSHMPDLILLGDRDLSSRRVVEVPAGTPIYRDRSGTVMVTTTKPLVMEDCGYDDSPFLRVRVQSTRFDGDTEVEDGLAFIRRDDVKQRVKTAAELAATAARFAPPPDCAAKVATATADLRTALDARTTALRRISAEAADAATFTH